MEVHHHPHVPNHAKPWKEYLLEGLMIFLAVSLGFIAENIREHISEQNKKKIHELSPFDKTSALRLDAFEKSENSREILKEIMEDLEEDLDIFLVNKKIKQLEFSFNATKYVIDVLAQYYSANAYKYEEKESAPSAFKSKR